MYIDPNTGGMLFQILAVLFVTFSGAILVFSGRIRKVIARLRRQMRERANPEVTKPIPGDETPPPTA